MTLYKRNGWWYVDVIREGVRVHRSVRTTRKRIAEKRHAEIVEQLEARGLELFVTERTPPLEVLEEYLAELRRRSCAPRYVAGVKGRAGAILERAPSMRSLTPSWVSMSLADLMGERELAASTINRYRDALGGLFAWLVQQGRWANNPVDRVRPAKTAGQRVLVRRALILEELRQLVEVAPLHRASCYLAAATTGLRRGELGALEVRDLDLDRATVRVRAEIAKNRRDAVLPLCSWAVEVLTEWTAGLPADQQVWAGNRPGVPGRVGVPGVKTLHRDMRGAGLEPRTAEGLVDFHALRYSCASILSRLGVQPSVVQAIMRHSTPRLTARYTEVRLGDVRRAVDKLTPSDDEERRSA